MQLDSLVSVWDGRKFIGFEVKSIGEVFSIWEDQEDMPGIRVGKFVAGFGKELKKVNFAEEIESFITKENDAGKKSSKDCADNFFFKKAYFVPNGELWLEDEAGNVIGKFNSVEDDFDV